MYTYGRVDVPWLSLPACSSWTLNLLKGIEFDVSESTLLRLVLNEYWFVRTTKGVISKGVTGARC